MNSNTYNQVNKTQQERIKKELRLAELINRARVNKKKIHRVKQRNNI